VESWRVNAERAIFSKEPTTRGGLSWALAGITIGLIGAFAISRVLETLLFEVKPRDPITYAGAGVMLAAIAAIACLIPAIRATRIDPLIALRSE
jgi:putative ABC transport system permease protein